MSRAAVNYLSTIAVVDLGLLVIGLFVIDLCRRELGLRLVSAYRRSGVAMTVIFVVVVTLRFSLL